MNELLKTSEVADRLGLKEGTIRAWLTRYPEVFKEGDHHLHLDNKRFWTPAGVELLRSRVTQDVAPSVTLQATAEGANPSPGSQPGLDAKLEPLAEAIAYQVIEERLPLLVNQAIDRILSNPTDLDNQRMAEALDRIGNTLGLMKAASLLQGGLQAALNASRESLKSLPEGGLNV